MVEYIEREKAIAEIDKGDLLVGDNAKWAKEILCRTPTADVVPVVRCKECQNFNNYNPDRTYCEEHSDKWNDSMVFVEEDDYCSFGIRKGGVQDE